MIPASKAGFAHLLVVPLSLHEDSFVEEDQPWLPNHYKKIRDGTLLCRGDTIPCRDEAGKILQLHVSMIWHPRVHCPRRSPKRYLFHRAVTALMLEERNWLFVDFCQLQKWAGRLWACA